VEEVESRNEEYPMLLAFLELMMTLIDSPMPSKLGAGFRVPGFEPYLDFLRDSVLLKFASRAYKRPADKVFEKILDNQLDFMAVLLVLMSYAICFELSIISIVTTLRFPVLSVLLHNRLVSTRKLSCH